MCVGEAACTSIDKVNSLIGDGRELDQLFQFDLMDLDAGESKWKPVPFSLEKYKKLITKMQREIAWNTLFWSNHDQPRTVSRFGCTESEELWKRSAKMLAVALHLLKGTNYIYQGEEIGMTNVPFTDESQLRDIESINYLDAAKRHDSVEEAWNGIKKVGRDNARTPMQWSAKNQAGFTDGTPWIMVNPNYQTINVEKEMEDPDSILHFYKELIALKSSTPALIDGEYEEILREDPQIFGYLRRGEQETYAILCNMTGETAESSLPKELQQGEIVLHNMAGSEKHLRPYEALVIRC
jgi:oligo-1,6-glucosidase